ncbi:MAG: hypothetical protein LC659_10315 [Myxococcales bacterium]|nr:hypothetical protein [Myxococcales bacterium]
MQRIALVARVAASADAAGGRRAAGIEIGDVAAVVVDAEPPARVGVERLPRHARARVHRAGGAALGDARGAQLRQDRRPAAAGDEVARVDPPGRQRAREKIFRLRDAVLGGVERLERFAILPGDRQILLRRQDDGRRHAYHDGDQHEDDQQREAAITSARAAAHDRRLALQGDGQLRAHESP